MAMGQPTTKHTGAVYTPPRVAAFLSDWAVGSGARVLEPSAGDGRFVEAVVATGRASAVCAIELDPYAAAAAHRRGNGAAITFVGDFFDWYRSNRPDGEFDAVVGNPPFIRYQHFADEHRLPAFELMREEGLKPSRLTNAWLPFVVAATRALRPGGKLAMVLPAELLQVNYARELREFLVKKYTQLHLITFQKLLFDGIEQETVLLLGDRCDSEGAEISFTELEDINSLDMCSVGKSPSVHADIDHARDKWLQFFLTPREFGLIRELEKSTLSRLGDFAEVDVGIVTGRNEFFVLTEESMKNWGLTGHCQPLVSKSAHVKGLVLSRGDWEALAKAGASCLLLQLGPSDRGELSKASLKYVKWGEAEGYHTGYKCRIRSPRWWNVPSIWTPDAFMTRQIYDGPRIIANDAGAVCTDTIHRLRTRPDVDRKQLASLSMNSLTWAFAEIKGRSYGGGVLELEPREAEALPLPIGPEEIALDLEELDATAKLGKSHEVRRVVDKAVLGHVGLSEGDIALLNEIWERLSTRRLQRR